MNLRSIKGFPGYFVSASGHVYSSRQGALRRLRERQHRQGYVQFRLYRAGYPKGKLQCAHVLVANAWLPPRPSPQHEVNHKNNVKSDNRRRNLEWGTKSHNCLHREGHRKRPAWSGRKTPERMIRALQMIAAGKTRRYVQQVTGYSHGMVRALFEGRRGRSIQISRNGHEAQSFAA